MSRCVEVESIEGHVKNKTALGWREGAFRGAMGIKDERRVEAECREL